LFLAPVSSMGKFSLMLAPFYVKRLQMGKSASNTMTRTRTTSSRRETILSTMRDSSRDTDLLLSLLWKVVQWRMLQKRRRSITRWRALWLGKYKLRKQKKRWEKELWLAINHHQERLKVGGQALKLKGTSDILLSTLLKDIELILNNFFMLSR